MSRKPKPPTSQKVHNAALRAHLAATGEIAPKRWANECFIPADMQRHHGYVALAPEPQTTRGPFAWYENAVNAAQRLHGIVTTADWLQRHRRISQG